VAVQAVIFDWGGTLTPWHTIDFAECWLACGFDRGMADKLWASEEAIWRRARDAQRSGTLAEVFAAVDIEMTPAVLRDYFRWWEEHTYTDPEVPALFGALRERGIKVGVLSNTLWPRVEHDRVFQRDGVYDLIDAAVYTSEIEWTKPHPEAFRTALAALGVADPAAGVFVGDRPWDDIHGAHGVGLRAVLLPHSEIPEHQKGPVDGDPDAVVQRLSDLLSIIDGWR
jgi:putative hydrolase of the HAD superfamily